MKFLLAILLLTLPCHAACHAVTTSGASTGADWAHPMSWPTTPVRGDTYYLANGTFSNPSYVSNGIAPHTGGATITFKKARDAGDHGQSCSPSIAAGWSSAMDAQAILHNTFEVSDDNWAIDGQDNGGAAIDNCGSYGIEIDATGGGYGISSLQGANVTAQYVCVPGNGPNAITSTCDAAQNCNLTEQFHFVDFNGLGSGCGGWAIRHSYAFNSGLNFFTISGCPNGTVEYNELNQNAASTFASNFYHGQAMNIVDGGNDNWTIRYNVFRNIVGTGIIVYLASSGGTNTGINIYGNVFFADSSIASTQTITNGVFACINNIVCNDLQFYNNSVVSYPGASEVAYLNTANVATGHFATVENNLWYGSSGGGVGLQGSGTKTQDHNSFLSSGTGSTGTANVINGSASCPFVNCVTWSGPSQFIPPSDSANINNGVTLASPFNTDPAGTTRVVGDWTRGAYQFGSGTPATVPAPAAGMFAGLWWPIP